MAQDNTKIMKGPARIFLGGTPPVTGTPPTLVAHTSGVPSAPAGVEVGHTEGDAVFTYQLKKNDIKSEQVLASIDVVAEEELAMIEFVCQEVTYNTLISAFDNVGTVTDGAKDLFYFGGGTAVLAPKTQVVTLTAIQRNAPTKFIVVCLYKVWTSEGFKSNYGRTNRLNYKMILYALADTSRNAGDYMGQWFREK